MQLYRRFGSEAERFWDKVQKSDGCWLWLASRKAHGYGQFGARGGRSTGAHRFSYEMAYGPIPDGMDVCHRCDNPPCVNPAHLFLGTRSDNMRDCIAKGRWRASAKQHTCRLPRGWPFPTHCQHGHEYTPENTYVYVRESKGWQQRRCRTCRRMRDTKDREKQAA